MSKRTTIPRAWLHVAADLLDRASEEFGRHGCNDYPLPEWMTREDRLALDRAYHEYNGDPDEEPSDSPVGFDFCLMSFFAEEIRKLAGPVPKLTKEQRKAIEREKAEREARAAEARAAYEVRIADEAQRRAERARADAEAAAAKLKK
jgi:hypothetical protein